jgi:hypothetical protein
MPTLHEAGGETSLRVSTTLVSHDQASGDAAPVRQLPAASKALFIAQVQGVRADAAHSVKLVDIRPNGKEIVLAWGASRLDGYGGFTLQLEVGPLVVPGVHILVLDIDGRRFDGSALKVAVA